MSGSVGRYAALIAQKHDRAKLSIPGATILKVPTITMPEEWCDYYGVKVTRGKAILFKAVDGAFASAHLTPSGDHLVYAPASTPEAPDWDGPKRECGGGIHLSPSPLAALTFFPEATRFVGCPVRLADIVVHKDAEYPAKVKARQIAPPGCFEVDRDGEPIAAAKAQA